CGPSSAQELHGNILERQRRTMEELEDVPAHAKLDQRRDRRVAKTRIGCADHAREHARRKFVTHERRNHPLGDRRIGLGGKRRDLVATDLRPAFRHIEAPSRARPVRTASEKLSAGAWPRVETNCIEENATPENGWRNLEKATGRRKRNGRPDSFPQPAPLSLCSCTGKLLPPDPLGEHDARRQRKT